MQTKTTLILIALLILTPLAQARQDTWTGVNELLSGAHEFPDALVPIGENFTVTAQVWGVTPAVDLVTWGPLIIRGDCIIIEDTLMGVPDSAIFTAVLEMTGPTCSWHRQAEGTDIVPIGPDNVVGFITVTGTVSAFELQDAGQTTTYAVHSFWVPLMFWLVVLILALSQHYLWIAGFSLPALMQTLIPSLPGTFEGWFMFCLTGLLMEYFWAVYVKPKRGE